MFFGAHSSLKTSIYWHQEKFRKDFRKNLRSVSQKWISQNFTKLDPWARQGVETLKGASATLLNPPRISNQQQQVVLFCD